MGHFAHIVVFSLLQRLQGRRKYFVFGVFILHLLMFGFFIFFMLYGPFPHIVVFSLLQRLQGRRKYLF